MINLSRWCILLHILFGTVLKCRAQVPITTPPENTTVCRGSDVTISCGYQSPLALAPRWIINDDLFTETDIINSDIFELNNPSIPNATSLTVLSINDTTTIQCVIPVSGEVFSSVGTVTVIGAPTIGIITVTEGCGYIYVSWTYNSNACGNVIYNVMLSSTALNMARLNTTVNAYFNFTGLPRSTSFNVTIEGSNSVGNGSNTTSATTLILEVPDAPMILEKSNISMDISTIMITVYWKAPMISNNCTANIIMYNVTVMDQYSPAFVLVPANMTSVKISELEDNGTRIVIDRKYRIMVSAIIMIELNMTGVSNQSDTVIVDTFVLQNCSAVPLTEAINVSCDSPHQIQVTVKCDNCTSRIKSGPSPLTVPELDPGMYYVTINVFNGSQVVFSNRTVMESVVVMMSNGGGGNNITSDDDDGSSIGAIVGGVVGGIATVIVVVIIIIVVYFCYCRGKDSTDDTQGLKSPTSTGGTHTASIKPAANVPHQTAASGEEYAVTTKVAATTKPQQPTEEYAMVDKAKKHAAATQGIHYADLQNLPTSGNKPPTNQGPTATYAQVA